jgi:hypothetical protein
MCTNIALTLQRLQLEWMLYCGTLGTPFEPYGHCSLKEKARGVIRRTGGSPGGPTTKDYWLSEGVTKVWLWNLLQSHLPQSTNVLRRILAI